MPSGNKDANRGHKSTGRGATRGHSPTSPEAIERHERDLQCVELRKAGLTWQQITDQLGYGSKGHAYDRFMIVMREYPREDVETVRDLICDRYDAMIRALWPKALQGDVWAIDRVTRILDQLARLTGANRPERIEVTAGEADLDATMRELVEQLSRRATQSGEPVPKE